MKRYQIYLDPNVVAVLDDFEKAAGISRSKLIREAMERFALQLAKLLNTAKVSSQREYVFNKLIGFIDLKNQKITNYASKKDTDYLRD